jgi:hypothetical protein
MSIVCLAAMRAASHGYGPIHNVTVNLSATWVSTMLGRYHIDVYLFYAVCLDGSQQLLFRSAKKSFGPGNLIFSRPVEDWSFLVLVAPGRAENERVYGAIVESVELFCSESFVSIVGALEKNTNK